MNESDQLLKTYLLWKENPSAYNKEIMVTADRLINHFIKNYPYRPMEFGFQSKEDLQQELRLAFFRAFDKTVDPTNKRLYNYTKNYVVGRLKDLQRSYCRKQDNKKANSYKNGKEVDKQVHNLLPDFGTSELNTIAELLANGYNKHEIKNQLNITERQYREMYKSLKQFYTTVK